MSEQPSRAVRVQRLVSQLEWRRDEYGWIYESTFTVWLYPYYRCETMWMVAYSKFPGAEVLHLPSYFCDEYIAARAAETVLINDKLANKV